jgi:ABC-type nitrate/sulfonate/bicarbonate transport system substrate-binding protein
MTGWRHLAPAVALAATTLLASSVTAADGTSTPRSGSEATVLVGMSTAISASVGADPILIAQQNGYFSKLGINVQLTAYNGGGVNLSALAAGQEEIIHIGMSAVGAAIVKGVGLTLVGADSVDLSQFGVWVPYSSSYKTVKDLSGGTIGVSSTGGTTYTYALSIAKKAGITVTPVPLGDPGDVVATAGGKVDASIALYQGAYPYLAAHDIRELAPLASLLPAQLSDGMVVENSFLQSHPGAVRAYMEGWWKGVEWMRTHKQQALAFMERTQSLSPYLANYQFTHVIMKDPYEGSFTNDEVRAAMQTGQIAMSVLPAISSYVTHKYS